MSTQEAQVVDPQEFIPILDYKFSGDSVTVDNKRKIVEGYRLKASIYHAAQFAGVARQTVYRYLENDPQFHAAMDDSFEDAADILETSVYERAVSKDSLLAMFWLKAHRPKFRDRMTVDVEVVRNEIQERMAQLQLAPASVLDVVPQFRDESERKQKEPISNNGNNSGPSS